MEGIGAILIVWIAISLVIGYLGMDRKIGFGGGFFLSLLLSPIIGAIFVATSKENEAPITSLTSNISLRKINSEAIQYAKNDLDKGISILKEALMRSPNSKTTNYNIACFYSLKRDKEKSFYHLSIAIENGYNNFSNLKKDRDLGWLREQREWSEFVDNNYKHTLIEEYKKIKEKSSKKPENNSQTNKPENTNFADELRELKKLCDEGIITNDDFEEKKKQILNNIK